jgi:hypothetical protein
MMGRCILDVVEEGCANNSVNHSMLLHEQPLFSSFAVVVCSRNVSAKIIVGMRLTCHQAARVEVGGWPSSSCFSGAPSRSLAEGKHDSCRYPTSDAQVIFFLVLAR